MTAHALPMRRPKSISRFTNGGPAILPGCIGRRSLVDAIGGAMREYDILQRSRLLTGVQRVWSMCTPVGAGTDTTDRSWWSWMCGLHRRCIQRCATVAKNESLLAGDVDGNALWRRTFWPTQGLVESRFHRAECVLWGFDKKPVGSVAYWWRSST